LERIFKQGILEAHSPWNKSSLNIEELQLGTSVSAHQFHIFGNMQDENYR